MRRLIPLMVLFHLAGCTSMVPRSNLPYPLTNDTFAEQVKVVSIPLPVIATTPNEGITGGALVAFLLHNANNEVSTLVVPQVNYNDYFGTTTTLYGAFYPSPDTNWKVTLAKATTVNKEYRVRYTEQDFFSPLLELNLNAFNYSDGSARFFGFQSQSSRQDETNYADHEKGLNLSLGYRFYDDLQVVLGERYKSVAIERGAVTKLPFITDRFTPEAVPGVHGFTVHAQKISLVYNTLDSIELPTTGAYARVGVDNSFKALGSGASYRIFDAEAKVYLSKQNARYITVARAALSQTSGRRIPFLEQSILGGETTLRGYGQNRFIDSCFVLLNIEERIRLFRWEVFNVLADWEVAPFMDVGSVMRSFFAPRGSSLEFNPGIGIRAVVRPNIMGRIDVGVGREGPAVFVGLGYPF